LLSPVSDRDEMISLSFSDLILSPSKSQHNSVELRRKVDGSRIWLGWKRILFLKDRSGKVVKINNSVKRGKKQM
jgi:hypothetical protein